MQKLIKLAVLMACSSILADVQFDPNKIIKGERSWACGIAKYKGEYFRDIIYEEKIVFRILERFMPILESMLQDAIGRKGILNYKNVDSDGNFSSVECINKHFYVSENPRCVVTELPDRIILRKVCGIFSDDFYVNFACDNSSYEIPKSVFKQLSILKTTAKNQHRSIQIDLYAMLDYPSNPKLNFADCFWLVGEEISGNNSCAICLAKQKDTLFKPCNHLCACALCAKDIEKNCPVCQQAFTGKEKVYW